MISILKDIDKLVGELLYTDELKNALLIKCIAQGRADDLQVVGKSVCFRDRSSGNYFFSSENIIEFDTMYQIAKPQVFFLSSDTILRDLTEDYPNIEIHNYDQWIYTGKAAIDTKDYDWISFRALTLEDLPTIVATQHSAEFNATYFAEQIENYTTFCAVEKETGTVLGYFLMHKDGENGPLYVAEKCRNLGMGTELLKRITNEVLKKDKWPLGHLRTDNKPAQAISLKAGYERCPQEVLWCYEIR